MEVAKLITGFHPPRSSNVTEWINEASARDLMEFIRLTPTLDCHLENGLARVALDIRLAEDAAKTAETMLEQTKILTEHTEKLTIQTAEQIQHSEKLTMQTDELLKESVSLTKLTKQLKFWTIALVVFAVVQILIMVFDFLKHK